MRWSTRFDCQVGNDEQSKNHEGGDSHRPSKPDFGNKVVNHNGKDDPACTRTAHCYPKCMTAFVVKPCGNSTKGLGTEYRLVVRSSVKTDTIQYLQGVKTADAPMALTTPCDRRNW